MSPSHTLKPLSILIVDDDPDTADTYAALLECQGHRARAVYSGQDAVATAAADPPDVVLLDLTMPGMPGEVAAARLREIKPGVVLIAVTGRGSDADRLGAWQAGFTMHLVKPVEPAALAHILTEYQRRLAARG